MKKIIKHYLSRLGVFPSLNLVRKLPEIIQWIRAGCTRNAPEPLKHMVLSAYRRRYGLFQFIETGTYFGETLAYMAHQKSVHATSIELNDAYYKAAEQRFGGYSNVTILHGDSGKLLPELVRQLQAPALFWLDGHYSGGETARANLETPISAELEAILQSTVKGHVILIDDARDFNGSHDYPHLDRLLETVRVSSIYDIEVSTDIIRLTPKS
jgi:hypothetical protein